MGVLVFLALFLSFFSYSNAQYCLCKPGSQAPDPYQKVINYACGNGANCGPIQPNGPCYQANDVQAMCSYAANSYYQNQKSLGATCDFGGIAAPSATLPSDVPSGCTYPTSGGGTTTPISPPGGTPISPPGGTPTSPAGGTPTSPPGSFPSPPGGFPTSPPGVFPVTPPGSFPTSPPGTFSPGGLGPTGSFNDPLNSGTSLPRIQTYIVSLSVTLFATILCFG